MKSIESYIYTPTEIQLAHEISERLNDPNSLSQYLKNAKQVPHEVLREKLNYVCSVPERDITTSRAAYFVFLIKQWQRRNSADDYHGAFHPRR